MQWHLHSRQTSCYTATLVQRSAVAVVAPTMPVATLPALVATLCMLTCMQDGGLVHEPYTLAPLAQTLTAVQLSGTASLSLVLSLTDCSNVRQLTLQDITGVAGTPESVVQVLHSMPLLQELQLVQIHQSPMLERVSVDYAYWGVCTVI